MMTLFQCIKAYEQALTCVCIINFEMGMVIYKQLVEPRARSLAIIVTSVKENRFQSSRGSQAAVGEHLIRQITTI